MKARPLRRLLLALLVGSGMFLPSSAHAEHFCREKARGLHGEFQRLGASGTATEAQSEAILLRAVSDTPECTEEFRELVAWYVAGFAGPFPFPSGEDPHHGFLGPVGAWWNIVRFDILNGSWFLFFLFGWELFLLPVVPAVAIANVILGAFAYGMGRSLPRSGNRRQSLEEEEVLTQRQEPPSGAETEVTPVVPDASSDADQARRVEQLRSELQQSLEDSGADGTTSPPKAGSLHGRCEDCGAPSLGRSFSCPKCGGAIRYARRDDEA